MGDHEIDGIRRRLFGCTNEVALVLAIFGVDHDDDPPLANRFYGVVDGGKMMVQSFFVVGTLRVP